MFLFNLGGVNVAGQKLNRYSESSGGGMNGGHTQLIIERYDDTRALYSYESSGWYFQDPTVKEYFVDVKILDDIHEAFVAGRMNTWHNKKFTDEFVDDGETYSYSFGFDRDTVSFSSQIYPEKYSSKLKKLDEAIKPYTENMEAIPALVVPKPENEFESCIPCREGVGVYVSCYKKQNIYYKIVNDTSEEAVYSGRPVIKRLSDGAVAASGEELGTSTLYAYCNSEEYIKLDNMLEAGMYELTVGDYSCTFEIR